MTEPIFVPVSPGELLDKKTILDIKRERIADAAQRANVERELALLQGLAQRLLDGPLGDQLAKLERELRDINAALWDCENTVRRCERAGDFGQEFVDTARRIYSTNDLRATVKRQINQFLQSMIVEEKSHT